MFPSISLYRFVDAFYNDLKQYFDLDPHLLQIFIFLCPLEDLPSLFQSITPYQAVAGVAKLLQELVETTSAASTVSNFFFSIIFKFAIMHAAHCMSVSSNQDAHCY